MVEHYLLQNGSRISVLIRREGDYHIIDVNRQFDEEKEAAVLAEDCTVAQMRKLGVAFQTISRENLRGVAIGGSEAGCPVVFHLTKGKREFVLSDDYDAGALEQFFHGIPRFQPPKSIRKNRSRRDWRINEQVESVRRRMNTVGLAAQVLSYGSAIGVMVTSHNRWTIALTLLMLLADIGLYLAYPAYFTILYYKDYSKYGYRAKVRDMGMPTAFCLVALAVRGMTDFTLFFEPKEIVMVAVVCIVMGILLWRFSRECREHKEYIVLWLLTAALFTGPCLAQVNFLLDFDDPVAQMYSVAALERDSGGRGRTRYDCIVELENGGTLEVSINGRIYGELQPGDRVPIVIIEGGLGLTYAYFDLDTYDA